jgi:LysM repeat protein
MYKVFLIPSCYDCYNLKGLRSRWYIKNQNTGVGNMLFQISSGLSYAKENNALLFVPGLNTYFNSEELKKEDTIFRKINTDIVEEYDEKNIYYFSESDSCVFSLPFFNNIQFSGYLENFENFDKNRSLILDYFRPTEKDKIYLYNKYPFIKNDYISSLHIRMGQDIQQIYSNKEKNNFMLSYYEVIDHMITNKNINSFMVLTNDTEYCKKILKCEKYKSIKFYYSDEIHAFNDIWLISLMKNNIISFSTLSLWGSYLNENEDKYIVGSNKIVKEKLKYKEWIYI